MRNSEQGPKFLLAKKSNALSFLPGYWVFPGGAVDAEDEQASELETLRVTCVRELQEEINVDIQGVELTPFAHWITPKGSPKRFSTWFFLAALPDHLIEQVEVDGGELVESKWLTAQQAVTLHKVSEAAMLPPTLVALMRLQLFSSTAGIQLEPWAERVRTIEPKVTFFNDELTMVYPGDAAYGLEADCEGERHRCTESGGVWTYVNTADALNVLG